MASSWAIHDETTGEIRAVVIGGADLAAANTGAGEAALYRGGEIVSAERTFVDVSGTPVLDDRPAFAVTIPATVEAGAGLVIDAPEGTAITVEPILGGGGDYRTATAGPVPTDVSTVSDSAGDVLRVTLTLFPYSPLSGECEVVEPL